jgi:hypothetical protein
VPLPRAEPLPQAAPLGLGAAQPQHARHTPAA